MKVAKFQRIVCINNFWLLRRFQELSSTLLRLLWSLGFTRIRLYPLSGEILYQDSVSVIVPGSTSFVEDFVIRCYQVTKLFCSWNRSHITSSARNPRNSGSQAYVAISVFGDVSINTMLPFLCHQSCSTFRIWVLSFGGMCGHMRLQVRWMPVKGCNHSGVPCVGSSLSIPSFLYAGPRFPVAGLSGSFCISFTLAGLSLRAFTGSEDVSDSFCLKMKTILVRQDVRSCRL